MKTKEFSEIFGISRESLRNYEKQGILHPYTLNNGYRDYTTKDLQMMIAHEGMQKLGILLQPRTSLFNDIDPSDAFKLLLKHKKAHEMKLLRQEAIVDNYRSITSAIETFESFKDTIIPEIYESAAFIPYCRFTNAFTSFEDLSISVNEFRKCLEYADIAKCEIRFRATKKEIEGYLQFSMKYKFAQQFADSPFKNAEIQKESNALSIYKLIDNTALLVPLVQELFQYAVQTKQLRKDSAAIIVTPLLGISNKLEKAICKITLLLDEDPNASSR